MTELSNEIAGLQQLVDSEVIKQIVDQAEQLGTEAEG